MNLQPGHYIIFIICSLFIIGSTCILIDIFSLKPKKPPKNRKNNKPSPVLDYDIIINDYDNV